MVQWCTLDSVITPTTFPGGPGGPWAPLSERVKNVNPVTNKIKKTKHKDKAKQQTWSPFSPLGPAGPELPFDQNQKNHPAVGENSTVLNISVSHRAQALLGLR